jgi:hypothetical protein
MTQTQARKAMNKLKEKLPSQVLNQCNFYIYSTDDEWYVGTI